MKRLKILFFFVLVCISFNVQSMQEESKKLSIQATASNAVCLKTTEYFKIKKNNSNSLNFVKSINKPKKESYWDTLKGATGLSLLMAGIPLIAHWGIKNVDLRNRISFEQLKTMDGDLANCIERVSKQVAVNPSSLEYMYNDYDSISMNQGVPWVMHLNSSQFKGRSEAWSDFTIAHELMHFKKLHALKQWAYMLTAPIVNIPLECACKYYAQLVDTSLSSLQRRFGYENNFYINKFRSLHTSIMNSPLTPLLLQAYIFKRIRMACEKEADIEAAHALNSAQGGIDMFYDRWVWLACNPLWQFIDDHPSDYDRWQYLSALQKEFELKK